MREIMSELQDKNTILTFFLTKVYISQFWRLFNFSEGENFDKNSRNSDITRSCVLKSKSRAINVQF